MKRRLTLTVLFLLTMCFVVGQKADTSKYLPQISLSATNGFGPYVIGTIQGNTILANDLPANTSKAMFRFIDADSVQVGNSYVIQGTSLDSVSWNVQLDSLNLPLSPQLQLELTYSGDSIADYYVAFIVYPDTVSFQATNGWGPFITNNYPFSDTSWHPVPELNNTFTVKNLPPRTDTVIFQVFTNDSTLITAHTVVAAPGHDLDSAVFSNVRMDNLPLSTASLETLIHASGAPVKGLGFHKNFVTAPHKPRLTSKVQGTTLNDSIPLIRENPASGQSLMVDSVKYARITNGPGEPWFGGYRGPYSMDVILDDFSIESWLRMNLAAITHYTQKELYFMSVDSVFAVSFISESDGTQSAFRLYAFAGGIYYQLYEAIFNNTLFGGNQWHHLAIVINRFSNIYKFYLDGNPIPTTVNQDNINYILGNTNYTHNLKTQPLILGGNDKTEHSFITAFDEVRIWRRELLQSEIRTNMHNPVLQDVSLMGYWNFDDLRNRLHYISDLSYLNNSGELKNGAVFIPQYPDLYVVSDTIIVHSSNLNTDSVQFAFLDETKHAADSLKIKVQNRTALLAYDISTLPYSVNQLRVREIYPGGSESNAGTDYNLKITAPAPVATPQTNWGTFYYNGSFGSLQNTILVNGLPANTSKVLLGLKNGDTLYNVDTDTLNSVPYQYSLSLNGTDNYIQTSQQIAGLKNIQVSLWFKTTTTAGGELIGFCDMQNGIPASNSDREIYMEKDGSLRFVYINDLSTVTLYGSNKYNDGFWHCVTAAIDPNTVASLYVDNSLVDQSTFANTEYYNGYWVIGRNDGSKSAFNNNLSAYFKGSIAYVNILMYEKNTVTIPDKALLNGGARGNLLYRLDEGSGKQIHDTEGSNTATLQGTGQDWTKTNKISMIRWQHNMEDKYPGNYTFFAQVYYPGGDNNGVFYPLGTFDIEDPMPGSDFSFNLSNGNGYFNEGEQLTNTFFFETDYTGQGSPNWKNNFVSCDVVTLQHQVINHGIVTWKPAGYQGSLTIDMGDAPPGSYLSFQVGYEETSNTYVSLNSFSVPLLIRSMLAPTVSGDFGPFEQAIAPGTMAQQNTFTIFEEGLSDLSKVTGTFYDAAGNVIATAEGVHINDTTWQISQNMAVLSPPESSLKISYYLGTGNYLAMVAGPYQITIHKTRPEWFDMAGDSAFRNIQESGDIVTFQVDTPFDNSYLINNSTEMDIPKWVPLIGESSCTMEVPTGQAYLKYTKSESKLSLNQPPDFFQKVFNLGAGNASTLSFTFNETQSNSFNLDAKNNLFATQNFSTGGSITSGFNKLANIAEKIEEIIQAAEVVDPGSVIVKPSFEITYTGSFEYSSRLHLAIDSLSGKWGSYGNLNVDANPSHAEAFRNSSSYNFYSGSLGMEFGVGAELLEGLVSGHFGLDGRFLLGFGQSYVSMPRYLSKPLKSFAFQTYGRFYIDVFWGWYEKTVWGPKMFYSTTLWGDDMSNAFPPAGKKNMDVRPIPANSSRSDLANEIRLVSSICQTPLPRPQSVMHASDNYLLFNWLEKGEEFGERNLRGRYLDLSSHKFSKRHTIETNHHALNSPVSDVSGDSIAILTWAQSRTTEDTFTLIGASDPLRHFIESQDIWFAVYNLKKDSLLQMSKLDDDVSTLTSGRAEGNPKVTMLSPNRALITWQVVNMAVPQADIWYTFLEKSGTQWIQSNPAVAVSGTDFKTQVKIISPAENRAVLVWLTTNRAAPRFSKIMTSVFDGTAWSEPEVLSGQDEGYCNYLDLSFRGNTGGLVYTKFVEDVVNGHHEKLKLIPWESDHWNKDKVVELLVDSVNHLQLPKLAIYCEGVAAVAIKRERFTEKSENQKISQVDVFKGNLNTPAGSWNHAVANPFICDTSRQVSELNLSFVNKDTLFLLDQERAMFAANAASLPRNGIVFGDPYMNQVLRCFSVKDDGTVSDVDEHPYFLGVDDPQPQPVNTGILQCYPNPCRDHATLTFNLTGPAKTTLELFDIRGSEVATLIQNDLPTGIFQFDINTSLLKQGTYICRLQTGEYIRSLKLIVSR